MVDGWGRGFLLSGVAAASMVAAIGAPPAAAQTQQLPEIVVNAPSPIVRPARPRPAAPAPAAVTAPRLKRRPPPRSCRPAGSRSSPTSSPPSPWSPARNSSARPGGTLGDVLFAKPGITGSSFAPGAASRPIVRGLDTYRVRIQENGIGSSGVSELGEDHAVPLDPLAAERVEVVRGPATLALGLAGDRRRRQRHQQPDPRRAALPAAGADAQLWNAREGDRAGRHGRTMPEVRDARRLHQRRQRPRWRRHPRCRRGQLRLPRRRVRPARRRLPHPALSLSAAARPDAAVQRTAAELVAPRPTDSRSAAPTSSRTDLSASRCRASQASIACRDWNRRRPTPAST